MAADGTNPFQSRWKDGGNAAPAAPAGTDNPFQALWKEEPQATAKPAPAATPESSLWDRFTNAVSNVFRSNDELAADMAARGESIPLPAEGAPMGAAHADMATARAMAPLAAPVEKALARSIVGAERGAASSVADTAGTAAMIGGGAVAAPNLLYSALTGNNLYTKPQDFLFGQADAAKAFQEQQAAEAEKLGGAGRVGFGTGRLAADIAQFMLAPEAKLPEKLVGKAGASMARRFAEHTLANLPRAAMVGGARMGTGAEQQTLQHGGTKAQALGEGIVGGIGGTAQFVAPVSAPGNLAVRMLSGEAIQQGLSLSQQAAQHAIAPEAFGPVQAPDPTDPMTYFGAVLAALAGRRAGLPIESGKTAPAPEAKALESTESALQKAGFTPEQVADFKRSVEQKQAEQAQPAPEAPQRPPEPEAAQPTPEPVAESAQTQVKPENVALRPEPAPEDHATQANPVREVPLADIAGLDADVPQFKKGASETGEVEPLQGGFDRRGLGPIQLWQRKDGRLTVISGRHRYQHAIRTGQDTIPAQVYREADGFTQDMAASLDAELNIRDGQGSVADYAQYFQRPAFQGPNGRAEAESRGLLARATGRRAYTIARQGDPELVAAHRAGQITDEQAVQIAQGAPNDQALQALGMQRLQQGDSLTKAVNVMRAAKSMRGDRPAQQGDIFGLDDSAMRDASAMADAASKHQRDIGQRLAAISGAAKRPEVARAEGIDVHDPEAVRRRIEALRTERDSWENWETAPAKVAQLRSEAGLEPMPERAEPEAEPVPPVDDQTQAMFARTRRDDATGDLLGGNDPARQPEPPPAPRPHTSDMFGGPTTRDRVGAAERAKDAQRNGQVGGREDTGDGGLFDGKRPAQADIERPVFQNARKPESVPPGRVSAQEVDRIASGVLGVDAEKARVHTVASFEQLPEAVRKAAEAEGVRAGDIDAVHYKGHSYILADMMRDADAVRKAVFHELYTHGGLRAKYGNRLGDKLDNLLQGIGGEDGLRRMADKQGIDLSEYERANAKDTRRTGREKKLLLMEELLAHMSHTTGTLRRTIEEWLGTLRDWLRKRGFPGLAEYKASDLALVLKQARQAARESMGLPADKPMFQRVFHGGPHRGIEKNGGFKLNKIGNDVTPYYSRRVGDGDHGPVFEADNYHEAVDILLRAKAGEVKSALFHPSIGHADLIYGKQGSPAKDYADGYGLAKIIAKHPEVDVKSLENELLAAREPRYHGNVAEFDTPRYTMAFKRDWRGQKKTWLLTAFDPKEESATGSTRIGAAAARDEARSNPVADKTSLPQTDTPAFRRWFGGSKVVDAAGKPLVVYHGAPDARFMQEDATFKTHGERFGKQEPGDRVFWFSDHATARSYADDHRAFDYQNAEPAIIPVYLKLENPLVIDAQGREWREAQARGKTSDVIDEARAGGHDGIIIRNVRDNYNNTPRTKPHDTYAVFDSRQIKSATGNRGTFDAGNPDIRFSRREGEEPAAPEHDVTMGRGFSGPAVDAPDVPTRVPARQRTADMFDKPFPINEGRADKARFYLQDKFIDLQRIQEGIESTTRQVLDDAANVKQSAELFTSRTAAQIEDVRANVERPIVNLIHNSGLDVDAVGDWLTARHAVERNARIREIRPDMDSGSGMSDADAKATLARYSGNEAMQRIGAIADWIVSKNRQMQVGAGLVSAEEALGWQQMYQHYVPLKGFENTPEGVRANFEGPGRGFDVRGKVKHAFGRKSRSANPLANLLADYERTIVRANKAEVGRALYKLAADHPNSALWEINKVPSVPRIDKQTGLVTYGPDPMYKFADNVINVKIDGEDHTITMHGEQGERFAKAFKNLSTEMQSSVIRGLSRVNRYLAAVNTSLNPEFMLSNFVRDVQTAFVNLSGTEAKAVRGKVIRDIPHAMKALRDVLRKGKADSEWGQYAKEFRSDGGMTMWLDAHYDVDKLTSSLARQVRNLKRGGLHPARVFSTIGKFIEDYNKIVENGVRLSTYVHARKLGLSRPKAAHLAKDLTVNFDRKGQLGPVINSLYLFFNASMQGSVRVLQALKHPAVRRIVYATIAASAGMSIANRAVGGKDEDGVSFYDKIPDYEKERNLILMLPPDLDLPDWMESEQGGGKYIKITLPYGYNVFKVVGDQIGDALAAGLGYKQHFQPVSGAVAVMNSVIGAFNPLGSSPFDVPAQTLAPSVADPAVQIWTNKTWYGAPMYPDKNPFANTPKPDTQLYWNSTSQAARKLASLLGKTTGGDEIVPGAIDVSPITLDTLWDTITGGAGATALRASKVGTKLATGGDLEPREIPFVRKVLGAVESRRFDRQTYYDNLTRIGQAKQELEAATTPARRKEVVETWGPYLRSRGIERASERALRNLRAQQKRVEASSLSEKEKKARKEKIEAQMHTVRTRLNVAVENAREQAKAQP